MVSSPAAEPEGETLMPSQAEGEPVKSPDSTAAAENGSNNTTNTEKEEPAASPEMKPVGQSSTVAKWPGWPGFIVFRLIVPVLKVGSIIGRKGELVKKLCEETGARIRVLEGALGTSDRIVLIAGKEDPDLQLAPAMDAVLRVFKHISGLSPIEGGSTVSATAMTSYCSMRLLVAYSQAIHLIGKHGSTIKSIKETSGASLQILSDEVPPYATPDERIVEIHGEASKVLSAGEAVLKQLRKFLVDQSVLPVFEKTCNNTTMHDPVTESYNSQSLNMPIPLAHGPQLGFHSDFSHPAKRDNLLFNPEIPVDSKLSHSAVSRYGQDPGPADVGSFALGRVHTPIVTQITKVIQVALSFAEDIIGLGGGNIGFIRRTSGAVLSVQESKALPDEITIEIKGTSSQVQRAEQLIQESINNNNNKKEAALSIYRNADPGLSSYSNPTHHLYSTTSYQSQSLGGRGYRNFRY